MDSGEVYALPLVSHQGTHADNFRKTRAPTQRRKVVGPSLPPAVGAISLTVLQIESDEEEEDGSDSDAAPAPRKPNKRRRVERSLPGALTCHFEIPPVAWIATDSHLAGSL